MYFQTNYEKLEEFNK